MRFLLPSPALPGQVRRSRTASARSQPLHQGTRVDETNPITGHCPACVRVTTAMLRQRQQCAQCLYRKVMTLLSALTRENLGFHGPKQIRSQTFDEKIILGKAYLAQKGCNCQRKDTDVTSFSVEERIAPDLDSGSGVESAFAAATRKMQQRKPMAHFRPQLSVGEGPA
jgi:hypothetical protein